MTRLNGRTQHAHKPTRWFVRSQGADRTPARHEVWGLLQWYDENVVRPNMGIMGVLRRVWWGITGQEHRLISPWVLIARKIEEEEAAKARKEVVKT